MQQTRAITIRLCGVTGQRSVAFDNTMNKMRAHANERAFFDVLVVADVASNITTHKKNTHTFPVVYAHV